MRHISGACTLWDKRAEARRRLSPIAGEMWYLYARRCIFMQMVTISEQQLWNMQLTAAYLPVLLPLLWAARVADTAGYIKNSLSHSPLTTWEEMNVTSLKLALFHRIGVISFQMFMTRACPSPTTSLKNALLASDRKGLSVQKKREVNSALKLPSCPGLN